MQGILAVKGQAFQLQMGIKEMPKKSQELFPLAQFGETYNKILADAIAIDPNAADKNWPSAVEISTADKGPKLTKARYCEIYGYLGMIVVNLT